ncbi:MAG: hypothetical protein JST09_07720 [Bacteroidetes bacterium]|nr:hypothetical protein [Bacteroidota bacterium]
MIKHKSTAPALLLFFLVSFVLSSCGRNQENIPSPEDEIGYSQPVTVPLKFSEEKKLIRDTVKKGGIRPVIKKLDLNLLPASVYDSSGFRAFAKRSEKSKFDFNKSLQPVNNVPQDIGRTILNLFNNAFYSVLQKKALNINGYEPTVSVSTKKLANRVEIKVKDNGIGVPQKVLGKIFQPFFTTKPAGQGTGPGLSLSYDIITKTHGGEIKVETKEGEGAEFIILLPL